MSEQKSRAGTGFVSWCNLHHWIPQRDVRKKIYSYLPGMERRLIKCAHGLLTPEAVAQREGSRSGVKGSMITNCAIEGYTTLMKWARQHGCPWHPMITYLVASYGHMHMLRWLIAEGECPWHTETAAAAAKAGNLEMLYVLHEAGFPLTDVTTGCAKDLRTLKLLRKLGSPW